MFCLIAQSAGRASGAIAQTQLPNATSADSSHAWETFRQILERTNDQLGHALAAQEGYVNVLSIIVAVLSALFTVGSIGAAILLYRQSEEAKKELTKLQDAATEQVLAAAKQVKESEKLVQEASAKVEALLQGARAQIAALDLQLNASIAQRHQEALLATGEARSLIERQQKELEKLRATLGSMFDSDGALVARDFRLGENSAETEDLLRRASSPKPSAE